MLPQTSVTSAHKQDAHTLTLVALIRLTNGQPVVTRSDNMPNGVRFVPATNADELTDAVRRVLAAQGVALDDAGLYLCPTELHESAQFPPLALPADAITFGTARTILYPEVSTNTGWQRDHRLVDAGRLRVYRVGSGLDTTRSVSRAAVMQLARWLATTAPA